MCFGRKITNEITSCTFGISSSVLYYSVQNNIEVIQLESSGVKNTVDILKAQSYY